MRFSDFLGRFVRIMSHCVVKTDGQPPNRSSTMKTTNRSSGLIATFAAGAILAGYSASASAEEPYQRITVAELKRAFKQQEEEQKRLEATPEYQAKKRQEEANRKRREQEKQLAKENELRLKMQAAELERMKLENKRLANGPAANDGGGSGGSGSDPVVVPPTILDAPRLFADPSMFPFGWFGKPPPSTTMPKMPGFKPAPAPKPATRFGR
jgi:hypothetical protein